MNLIWKIDNDYSDTATAHGLESQLSYRINISEVGDLSSIYINTLKWNYGTSGNLEYITTNWVTKDYCGDIVCVPLTPQERMQQIIQSRLAPAFHRSRSGLALARNESETRARSTLRHIIGERRFRKFMRDGFITVTSKTGLVYCIFPGHQMTEVYDRGVMVEKLCVVLSGNFPPTDSLIMRYLLILNDEGEFSSHANRFKGSNGVPRNIKVITQESLPDLWVQVKVA